MRNELAIELVKEFLPQVIHEQEIQELIKQYFSILQKLENEGQLT